MVRNAALDMLDGLPSNRIWQLVSPLLTDSSRGLRIRTVSVLAGVRPDDALAEFRTATEMEPDRSRYADVLAVPLHSSGRVDESMKVLKENLARHPDDRESLLALVTFNRDAGDIGAALEYAEQLSRITSNDHDLTRLTDDLRERLKR
jgi:Flp pilus assembly protein TadD